MKLTSMYLKALQLDPEKRNIIKTIKACTKLSRDHLTPEIQLHLITPECNLWSAPADQSPFLDPFWAFYWPGGQAISRYVLDNKELFAGKKVLDVGSGSGACAIAAAKAGAQIVTANDIDNVSCTAIEMNCEINNVSVEISDQDLVGSDGEKWDCILVGDMFYDSEFGLKMFSWLKLLSRRSKLIFVGDPGRHAFTDSNMKNYIKCEGQYSLSKNTCMENNGFKTVSVWKFV